MNNLSHFFNHYSSVCRFEYFEMFFLMMLRKLFLLFLIDGVFSEPGQYSCTEGISCLPLRDCTEYMDFIDATRPLHQYLIKFLVEQQCGFQNAEPKVCCDVIPESLKFIISVSRSKLNKLSVREERSVKQFKSHLRNEAPKMENKSRRLQYIGSIDLR